jgi:hypothetical protein
MHECTHSSEDSERVLAPEARFTPYEGGVRIWDERLVLRPVNTQRALSRVLSNVLTKEAHWTYSGLLQMGPISMLEKVAYWAHGTQLA